MLFVCISIAQNPSVKEKDSIKKADFFKKIGNGYFPLGPFNLDLRYLFKFNQFEGFRTGLGGTTNNRFSEKYRLNGYLVYGFVDNRYKYSFGGGFRVNKASNTWVNLAYTDDLQETGSSTFLTDKRFFTFFEPRLLNIDLFHRYIATSVSLEHQFSNQLLAELQVSTTNIHPTYNYLYVGRDGTFSNFDLSILKASFQWSPFNKTKTANHQKKIEKESYPKFTFQFAQGFKSVLGSDFNFSKIDFRVFQKFAHKNDAITSLTLVAGLGDGDIPLTHLYHAYPNNINKATVLQRFSVAGLNSFETMFFNEFFSDKFSTLQIKHFLKPFKISKRFRPQLVLISRYAVGDMNSIDRHQGIEFNTLDQLYSESGFEINKLLFGFGLSFAYRYGSYHLPNLADNIAFKFTFNLSL